MDKNDKRFVDRMYSIALIMIKVLVTSSSFAKYQCFSF